MSSGRRPTEDRDFLAAAAEAAGGDRLGRSALAAARRAAQGERAAAPASRSSMPLRRALTGRDSGPEMAALLPLIGREETIARLRAAAG